MEYKEVVKDYWAWFSSPEETDPDFQYSDSPLHFTKDEYLAEFLWRIAYKVVEVKNIHTLRTAAGDVDDAKIEETMEISRWVEDTNVRTHARFGVLRFRGVPFASHKVVIPFRKPQLFCSSSSDLLLVACGCCY